MIALPHDAVVRLYVRGDAWIVTISPASGPTDPDTLCTRPGCTTAILSHDPGVNWPDKRGEAMAAAALAQAGGAVLMVFSSAADALACHHRLLRDGGR
jgi:hypothetical protein